MTASPALARRLREGSRRKVAARLRADGNVDILLGGVCCGLIARTDRGWKWTSWDGPARAGSKQFPSAAAAADARWGVAARAAVSALFAPGACAIREREPQADRAAASAEKRRAEYAVDAAIAAEKAGQGSTAEIVDAWQNLKPHLRAAQECPATSDPIGFNLAEENNGV